jgi:hypothetical protein
VPNGLVAKQIAVGYKHSCALKIDGTVESWGNDEHGDTTVPNGLVAKQVAAGEGFSYALKMDFIAQVLLLPNATGITIN